MSISSIEKYFKKLFLEDKIGHAYLFANVEYETISDELEKIINSYIFKTKIPILNNPDIYIIEPEKNVIKKEKIIDLGRNLSKMSQINGKKLYIIKESEKLNDFAANALLKTLEEPEKNIIAFLFTTNPEKVISTIKSRCQIINCEGDKKLLYDEETLLKALSFIKHVEQKKTEAIAYAGSSIYKISEKEDLKKVLSVVEYFYKDCLNEINGLKIEYFLDLKDQIDKICSSNTKEKLIKKVIITNKNIELLNYNLNNNMFIDKLLIELGRI